MPGDTSCLGPDCYRMPLLRNRIIWVYITPFRPELWQNNSRDELQCNLWLEKRGRLSLHSSTLQPAFASRSVLLSRRTLDLKAGVRQFVLLPLPRMLLTICPVLPHHYSRTSSDKDVPVPPRGQHSQRAARIHMTIHVPCVPLDKHV